MKTLKNHINEALLSNKNEQITESKKVTLTDVNNAIFKYESGKTDKWPYAVIAAWSAQGGAMEPHMIKSNVDKESGRLK